MSSRDHYDHRKRGRPTERRPPPDREDDHYRRGAERSRSRSRSRSPPTSSSSSHHAAAAESKKSRLEAERQARMARLRAENEQEEARLAALEKQASEPAPPSGAEQILHVDEKELEGLEEEEQMRMLLGFAGGFGSTKNEKVADNHRTHAAGGVAKNKARKYRQYMNRKNGFNRPLDKMD